MIPLDSRDATASFLRALLARTAACPAHPTVWHFAPILPIRVSAIIVVVFLVFIFFYFFLFILVGCATTTELKADAIPARVRPPVNEELPRLGFRVAKAGARSE